MPTRLIHKHQHEIVGEVIRSDEIRPFRAEWGFWASYYVADREDFQMKGYRRLPLDSVFS
jgi:hypothetical protein